MFLCIITSKIYGFNDIYHTKKIPHTDYIIIVTYGIFLFTFPLKQLNQFQIFPHISSCRKKS